MKNNIILFLIRLAFWLIAFSLGLNSSAKACDFGRNWSREDTFRQVAYTVLHIVDWGTTRDLVTKEKLVVTDAWTKEGITYVRVEKEYRHDINFFIENNRKYVDEYFIGTLVLQTLIPPLLPPEPSGFLGRIGLDMSWRELYQTVWIGFEGNCAGTNFADGLSINFRFHR